MDYKNWPYGPKAGYRSEKNHRFRTQDLFYEFNQSGTALYTLSEVEVEAEGKVYASAHAIYVNAQDDYDAGMKLVGNRRHWDALKKAPWFADRLESWSEEQKELRKTNLRLLLMEQVEDIEVKDNDRRAAIKMLLDMDNGKSGRGPGRPKQEPKPSPKSPKSAGADYEEDAGRILNFNGGS